MKTHNKQYVETVQRTHDPSGDWVLTRHIGGGNTHECGACYILMEKHITTGLKLARAAVDAVVRVDDFEGAREYLPNCRRALEQALEVISLLEDPSSTPE